MKVSVKESDAPCCKRFVFAQEGVGGFIISEYELPEFVQVLETIEDGSVTFFHENLGVRCSHGSVTILRLRTREEVLLKLSFKQRTNLAQTLRSSYPLYFH